MTLHKLHPERGTTGGDAAALGIQLTFDVYDVARELIGARAAQTCEFDLRELPVYRRLRWSADRKLSELFDDFALDPAYTAHRLGDGTLMLSAPGLFVVARGYAKGDYCSCSFQMWAESRARVAEVETELRRLTRDVRKDDETFVLDWYFCASGGNLQNSSFEEVAPETLLDEAYPSLGSSVDAFVEGYLAANESALILLGPPGGGKTRLVRAILAALTRRKGSNAEIMYTTDRRALASDEMFVQFITGSHEAFVIEDTDNLLRARTSGNDEMHRFLAVADGIARAQRRKIIFTTNLPNVSDIDPALVRPGRCYAVKQLRSLTPEEALKLGVRICGEDAARLSRARQALDAMAARSYSVAQVYRACV
jgi:ATPase family associated with various cellular activities (AAA)